MISTPSWETIDRLTAERDAAVARAEWLETLLTAAARYVDHADYNVVLAAQIRSTLAERVESRLAAEQEAGT